MSLYILPERTMAKRKETRAPLQASHLRVLAINCANPAPSSVHATLPTISLSIGVHNTSFTEKLRATK
jgi:hypothetical protein